MFEEKSKLFIPLSFRNIEIHSRIFVFCLLIYTFIRFKMCVLLYIAIANEQVFMNKLISFSFDQHKYTCFFEYYLTLFSEKVDYPKLDHLIYLNLRN